MYKGTWKNVGVGFEISLWKQNSISYIYILIGYLTSVMVSFTSTKNSSYKLIFEKYVFYKTNKTFFGFVLSNVQCFIQSFIFYEEEYVLFIKKHTHAQSFYCRYRIGFSTKINLFIRSFYDRSHWHFFFFLEVIFYSQVANCFVFSSLFPEAFFKISRI